MRRNSDPTKLKLVRRKLLFSPVQKGIVRQRIEHVTERVLGVLISGCPRSDFRGTPAIELVQRSHLSVSVLFTERGARVPGRKCCPVSFAVISFPHDDELPGAISFLGPADDGVNIAPRRIDRDTEQRQPDSLVAFN